MGYYHIKLRNKLKEDCKITTQWDKYEYPNGNLKIAVHISGENVIVTGCNRDFPPVISA